MIENAEGELGHMVRIFNYLLSQLEQAFAELQRFKADAAHELRAPLASLPTTGNRLSNGILRLTSFERQSAPCWKELIA